MNYPNWSIIDHSCQLIYSEHLLISFFSTIYFAQHDLEFGYVVCRS